ncbi:hypothetical protein [Streptomyces sp. NPDC057740]|uniref:hypothetical protein n=1 Tax=Streptomyces sp. NPDC057740 TaxID=3346234 RepID=UPI00369993A6
MTAHEETSEDLNQVEPPRTHLSTAGLRARGWTPGMMRQLLGEPDLLRSNPHFDAIPQTRLYSVERVEAVERSEEFRAAAALAARRSAAARAAALRRRREVLARIAAEPIEVPRLAPDRLAALAVEHRNRMDEERASRRSGHVVEPATVSGAEPGALARWKVESEPSTHPLRRDPRRVVPPHRPRGSGGTAAPPHLRRHLRGVPTPCTGVRTPTA